MITYAPIRIERDLWEAYGKVCEADGTNRSEDIREHVRRRVEEYQARL